MSRMQCNAIATASAVVFSSLPEEAHLNVHAADTLDAPCLQEGLVKHAGRGSQLAGRLTHLVPAGMMRDRGALAIRARALAGWGDWRACVPAACQLCQQGIIVGGRDLPLYQTTCWGSLPLQRRQPTGYRRPEQPRTPGWPGRAAKQAVVMVEERAAAAWLARRWRARMEVAWHQATWQRPLRARPREVRHTLTASRQHRVHRAQAQGRTRARDRAHLDIAWGQPNRRARTVAHVLFKLECTGLILHQVAPVEALLARVEARVRTCLFPPAVHHVRGCTSASSIRTTPAWQDLNQEAPHPGSTRCSSNAASQLAMPALNHAISPGTGRSGPRAASAPD